MRHLFFGGPLYGGPLFLLEITLKRRLAHALDAKTFIPANPILA